MANVHKSFLAFLCILISIMITSVVAGRNIPTDSKSTDVKQPDWFKFDRSVLIPGIGRVMIPKDKKGFNPFTYNPITGTNNGNGIGIPGFGAGSGGSGGITGRSYVPGGDDTYVPNPGVEVPNPGTSGNIPVPSAARP